LLLVNGKSSLLQGPSAAPATLSIPIACQGHATVEYANLMALQAAKEMLLREISIHFPRRRPEQPSRNVQGRRTEIECDYEKNDNVGCHLGYSLLAVGHSVNHLFSQ
jgi:hypothetical protein